MIIINDVVMGTDTVVLVSFADFLDDVDDVVDRAVSMLFSSLTLLLRLDDDALVEALLSSSDKYSS